MLHTRPKGGAGRSGRWLVLLSVFVVGLGGAVGCGAEESPQSPSTLMLPTEEAPRLAGGAWSELEDWHRLVGGGLQVVRPPGVVPVSGLFFDERRIAAAVDGHSVQVQVGLRNFGEQAEAGTLWMALRHLDGTLLDEATVPFAVEGFHTVSLSLGGLPDETTMADLATYVFDYELRLRSGSVMGARSVFEAVHKIELQVLTAARYAAGEDGFLRLFARNPATGVAAVGAQVVVELALPDGTMAEVARGLTDAHGALSTQLALPEGYEGEARLLVSVADDSGEDSAEAEVAVLPDARILLTTDKPLYQPGQTMHLRALALDRGHRSPMADREVVFEISDAAGNKVFKQRQTTDDFGIAATTFTLARQVNMGPFQLKALMGDVEVEKEVTVERYVLPKFKVDVTLNQGYYLPGETVQGTISARYFFGQPVAGGELTLIASTYDIGFTPFVELSGHLNDEGLYSFDFQMPNYVVGQPLEQGNGMVAVAVTVRDLADHEQSVQRATVVARADIEATLVPESGDLVPGVENQVYVVVSDPMGTPLSGEVTIEAEGETTTLALDGQGLGVWRFTPAEVPVDATVTITPAEGDPVTLTQTLKGGGAGRTILLRTNGALFQPGDTVEVGVLLPARRDRVFVDVIHAGRTVQTETLDAVGGFGHWSFEADESMVGAVQLHAYYLGAGSEIVRDERVIYVESADALNVALVADAPQYLPGEPATVTVEVTDAEGAPKVAALGIQVVDEAVFALQEVQPGLLKVYFELEEALSTPRYQFSWPDLQPTSVIDDDGPSGGTPADRELRAEVAFAAQEAGPGYGVDLNTHKVRLRDVEKLLKPVIEADRDALADAARDLYYAGVLGWENAREYVQGIEASDPWGQRYRFEEDTEADANENNWWGEENIVWKMISDGPDEKPDTADDLTVEIDAYRLIYGQDEMWAFGVEDGDAMAPGP